MDRNWHGPLPLKVWLLKVFAEREVSFSCPGMLVEFGFQVVSRRQVYKISQLCCLS
jgi:hypothetical protein